MIRKVYQIIAIDVESYDLVEQTYARNLKTANKIKKRLEKKGYEVSVYDVTYDYKHGAPILSEWVEG